MPVQDTLSSSIDALTPVRALMSFSTEALDFSI